ncbi:ABC transporter ATP-binding protein [Aquimarina sp. D1M17]|uniref:ABC transporter ATP-binding protein n=1 Tax=Aquimarina acroporae TaxID=2937283 RepID=UPI0020BDDCEF|nr:ABC transporter ATP-binding protein [Aquimarina acroporae]MCK8523629.1 ABC transporter ATP-binding protein [Aquimarina acroporae]
MKLEIKNVSKRYGRKKYGVKDFSLTIEKGILGLLGPNGAGKSTLMKMIATVNKPSEGIILLNKNNIVKDVNYIRQQMGFLPQDFGVYPNLNAFEFLEYMAAVKGVGGVGLKQRIEKLLDGLNLLDVASKPIGKYSGGMKQRIGIAQTLLNDPRIIIFDEPTVGLDPEERVRFRNLISDLATQSIVILSSHIVSDVDIIADEVAIMKKGSLITKGKTQNIIEQVKGKIFETQFDTDVSPRFSDHIKILSTTRYQGKTTVRYVSEVPIEKSTPQKPTLEDAYLYLTHN